MWLKKHNAILLFSILSIATFAQNTTLKNGDLLFINMHCGAMCEAINAVTDGFEGQDFNHVGMVYSDNDQDFYVYEAVSKGVIKTPVNDFLKRTDLVYKGTIKEPYQHLIPLAAEFCKSQLGVPYDNDFLYDNGKYYCSELLYDAFLFANHNEAFFQLFPMTYKEPNSENFFPVWIEHFAQQDIAIPEGKPGCNPGGISLDEKIEMSVLIP
ncbi:MAG TPA: YiiX/YebB-like N1pC/P60 family cysteine hydrolase [Flavobacterium sp.]|nr:YiiX/YebB-like N1pC/P60 family cysteine hydrolase [Flavobacterium sp.]